MTSSPPRTEAEKDLRREQIRAAATRLPGNRAQRRAAARRLLNQRAEQDRRNQQ